MSVYENIDIGPQPWFWGNLNKEEAKNVLMDYASGYFLVRASSTPGEYTLVVREEDGVHNIRIHHQKDSYGVVPQDCVFHSVAALVEHLQENAEVLHHYFPNIDLIQPVFRPDVVTEEEPFELLNRLVVKNKEWILLNCSYTSHVRKRKMAEMEMQECKTAITSLNAVLSLFEEQLTLQAMETAGNLMTPAALINFTHQESLAVNRATICNRVQLVRTRLQQKKQRYKELKATVLSEGDEIDSLKPAHLQLQQELTPLRLHVEERGVDKEYLDLLLKEEKSTDLSHYISSYWSVQCNRDEAEQLLADRVPGTFLVRPSRDGRSALSIVCGIDDKVEPRPQHCLIHHDSATGGYGFHPEYCIFASLQELVVKHQTISLKFYNPMLDVCLTYPVNYQHRTDDAVD